MHIRMRGGNDRFRLIRRLRDLVAIGFNKAGACLVARLELNLALKSLDLLLVEEVAVLIAILNALLAGHNRMARRGRGARDGGLPLNNADLGRRNGGLGNNGGLRLLGRRDRLDGGQRAVRIIL